MNTWKFMFCFLILLKNFFFNSVLFFNKIIRTKAQIDHLRNIFVECYKHISNIEKFQSKKLYNYFVLFELKNVVFKNDYNIIIMYKYENNQLQSK